MDALIQVLAGLDSKDGERIVAANPASCQVCNNCEGWENERVTPKERKIKVDQWPTPGFEIRTNLRAVIDAGENGCPTCGIFACAIKVYVPELDDDLEVKGWLPMPSGSLPVLWVKKKGEEDNSDGLKFDFFTAPDAPTPWPIFRPGKLFPEDTSSDSSLEQAKYWLHDCLENHPKCRSSTDSEPELPTRILDLGPPDTLEPQVRLHESKGGTGSYAALSHCWGRSQMIKTEQISLDARKKGIPFAALPKSFQHAITFVRQLGVRYLWIDSLCIIQDSEHDWAQESAKMASVYANSILTIAATRSSDSSGGCFSTVPESGRTRKITGVTKEDQEFTVYVRPHVRNWEKAPLPLYSRAWCFQERELAPRILHFEYHELKWQCNAITAHESALASTPHNPAKANGLGQESDPHSMNDKWRKTVREYVELDLTYESDRLPALSGLAKHIQKEYGRGKYLAGLWDDSLLEDLMWWVREEDVQNARRPKEWRAPSWSWAAVEARVQHRILPIKTVHCKIVGAFVVPAYADMTGAVGAGCLTLEGIVVKALLRLCQSQADREDGDLVGRRFAIEILGTTERKPHTMYADYDLETEGLGHVPDGEEVFCMCIATDQWHKCWLVLRRIRNKVAYERIGMAWQSHAQIKDGRDWASGSESTTFAIL